MHLYIQEWDQYIITLLFINQYRIHFYLQIHLEKEGRRIQRPQNRHQREIQLRGKDAIILIKTKNKDTKHLLIERGWLAVMVTNPHLPHPAFSRDSPCFWSCRGAAPASWPQAACPCCPEPPCHCAASQSARWVSHHGPRTRTDLSLGLDHTQGHHHQHHVHKDVLLSVSDTQTNITVKYTDFKMTCTFYSPEN